MSNSNKGDADAEAGANVAFLKGSNQFHAKEEEEECFYQLCTKYVGCWGYLTCGRFKDRNHAILCYLFTAMMVTLFLAIIFPLVIYSLADTEINSEVVIDSTSAPSYESWQTNVHGSGFDDIKIHYNLYFFDLQNPDAVMNGAKPVVVETGPYAYKEYYYKFDITWSDNGDTVSYNTQRYYVFDPENTGPGLQESDQLTLPYPTIIGFQYLLSTIPPEDSEKFDYFLVMKFTAMEKQYVDEIDLMLNDLSLQPQTPQVTDLEATLNAEKIAVQQYFNGLIQFVENSPPFTLMFKSAFCLSNTPISPFFKKGPSEAWFGWLNDPVLVGIQQVLAKAGSTSALSAAVPGAATNYSSVADTRRRRNVDTFKTGKKNPHQVAQYVYYQNMSIMHTCTNPMASQNTSQYTEGEQFPACEFFQRDWNASTAAKKGYSLPFGSDYANRIAGTDANMYGRPVTTDKVQVFVSDFYRSVYLINTGTEDWNGVPVKHFTINTKDILNATQNPENAQYYSFGPQGLLNTTDAAGIPVFVSFPNFLNGAPSLISAVKGMNPSASEHSSYLLVEPQTGLLVKAQKKLQVNYEVQNYSMPQLPSDSYDNFVTMCDSFTTTINQVSVITKPRPPYDRPKCALDDMAFFLPCWELPSKWTMENGAIFFPYGWVSEEVELPVSYADDLKNSLGLFDNLAAGVRFWGLVIAGILFAMICAMLVYMKIEDHQGSKTWYRKDDITNPLGFAFTADSNAPHGEVVEPLLSNSNGGGSRNGGSGTNKPQESYSFSA